MQTRPLLFFSFVLVLHVVGCAKTATTRNPGTGTVPKDGGTTEDDFGDWLNNGDDDDWWNQFDDDDDNTGDDDDDSGDAGPDASPDGSPPPPPPPAPQCVASTTNSGAKICTLTKTELGDSNCATGSTNISNCMIKANDWCKANGYASLGGGGVYDYTGDNVTILCFESGVTKHESITFAEDDSFPDPVLKTRWAQYRGRVWCDGTYPPLDYADDAIGPIAQNIDQDLATLLCFTSSTGDVFPSESSTGIQAACGTDPTNNAAANTLACSKAVTTACKAKSATYKIGVGPIQWSAGPYYRFICF